MPAGVVAVILPVVAPAGTLKVNLEAFTTVKLAVTPFSLTLVRPVKVVPATVTTSPTLPEVGEKFVMVGGATVTVKLPGDTPTPAGVITVTGPVAVPAGTVAVSLVAEITVNVATTLL